MKDDATRYSFPFLYFTSAENGVLCLFFIFVALVFISSFSHSGLYDASLGASTLSPRGFRSYISENFTEIPTSWVCQNQRNLHFDSNTPLLSLSPQLAVPLLTKLSLTSIPSLEQAIFVLITPWISLINFFHVSFLLFVSFSVSIYYYYRFIFVALNCMRKSSLSADANIFSAPGLVQRTQFKCTACAERIAKLISLVVHTHASLVLIPFYSNFTRLEFELISR